MDHRERTRLSQVNKRLVFRERKGLESNPSLSRGGELSKAQLDFKSYDWICGRARLDRRRRINSYLIEKLRGTGHSEPRCCPKTFRTGHSITFASRSAIVDVPTLTPNGPGLTDVTRTRSGWSLPLQRRGLPKNSANEIVGDCCGSSALNSLVPVVRRPRIRPGRRSARSAHGGAFAGHHLSAWYWLQWIGRHDRNPAGLHRSDITRSQSGSDRRRDGHNCNANQRRNHKQRHDMFDRGNIVIGNVRIDCDLRRRRNGIRKCGACHRRKFGHHRKFGNINLVGNLGDVGNADIVRNAGHVGNLGNVRLRLKQHCFIVHANIVHANLNVANRARRRRSNRNSVGIFRDWQSWRQFHTAGTGARCIAHRGHRGAECGGANDAHCLTDDFTRDDSK
jgi:hypothetical protein